MLIFVKSGSESIVSKARRAGLAARTQKLEDFKKPENIIYSCNYIIYCRSQGSQPIHGRLLVSTET